MTDTFKVYKTICKLKKDDLEYLTWFKGLVSELRNSKYFESTMNRLLQSVMLEIRYAKYDSRDDTER